MAARSISAINTFSLRPHVTAEEFDDIWVREPDGRLRPLVYDDHSYGALARAEHAARVAELEKRLAEAEGADAPAEVVPLRHRRGPNPAGG